MRPSLNILFFIFLFLSVSLHAQSTYQFPLSDDLLSTQDAQVNLGLLPNDSNETGSFGLVSVPVSTCSDISESAGFFFENNAGLSFPNNGFITNQFTIQFTFKIDELLVRSGRTTDWVQLIEFGDDGLDRGLYLIIDQATEGRATLNYWQISGGTGSSVRIGTPLFFNTTDLYQFTITRSTAGLLDIYVNGSLFEAGYSDTDQIYLPTSSEEIYFFRDLPTSILNDEASSGWVRDILISNTYSTASQIATQWSVFCDKLIDFDFEASQTCFGDTTVFNALVDISSADSVLWDFGDTQTDYTSSQPGASYVFSTTGSFEVTTRVYHQGVESSHSERVEILDSPSIDLGADREVVVGTSIQLDANTPGSASYLWNDGSLSPLNEVSSNEVGVQTYWVQVTNDLGCVGSDTVSVTYTELPELVVPNTFTPNGDGINDTWVIENITSIPDHTIRIYDRLGTLRHTLNDYQNTWNGTVGYKQLNQGTYFYFILSGGQVITRGSITILL